MKFIILKIGFYIYFKYNYRNNFFIPVRNQFTIEEKQIVTYFLMIIILIILINQFIQQIMVQTILHNLNNN